MSTLPVGCLIFFGSAGLLFGTSNMFANAKGVENAARRRMMMQTVVSLAIVAASFFIILAHQFDSANKYWAYGSLGMVVGYWLNARRGR